MKLIFIPLHNQPVMHYMIKFIPNDKQTSTPKPLEHDRVGGAEERRESQFAARRAAGSLAGDGEAGHGVCRQGEERSPSRRRRQRGETRPRL